jgi:hypothetical protein
MNDDEKRRKIDEILSGQKYIDKLNTEHVGKKGLMGDDLLEHFKNIQLDGSNIVIQLFMENPVKSLMINDDNNEVISISSGIQQIDKRKRNTDVATWGNTPFPVIDKGVIMAISPQVKLWYYEQREKLAKYDPIAAEEFVIPEVGDIVYTNHFMFKETRYYPNKQRKCEDFVKNVEEVRLENFDMLFKVTNYEIESIVKRDRAHLLLDNTKPIEERAIHVSLSEYEKEQEVEQVIE